METSVIQTANAFDISIVRAALDADYEVIEELGRGGMAVVYRARERALEREVAIKVLPAILSLDQDFVDRFQREARTAGQLEHPNIVPIYRVGQTGQIIFFVMKFLRGQSLAGVLRERGKLPGADVRRILIETASALGYAAKRGVVHRDIKPDNILLDSEGRCCVTDFGIAKTSGGPRTAAGTSMGTPRYMSPEHAQGIPVDGRSDIYSLGIVAYELLTGMTPFTGEDPFAVLYKHINAPLPIPELVGEEEKQVFSVIERMLAKNPEERFQHAYELIAALGGETTGTTLISGGVPILQSAVVPTEIMATGPLTRLRRRVRSDKRVWIGVAAAVILVDGIVLWRVQQAPPRVITTKAVPKAVADSIVNAARASIGSTTGALAPSGALAASGVIAPAGSTTGAASSTTGRATKKVASVAAPVRKPTPPPFSRCPATPRVFALMVDSVKNVMQGRRVTVNFDVCGLPANTAFSGSMRVARIRQSRIKRLVAGGVTPVEQEVLNVAQSSRSRFSRNLPTTGFPPGTYQLDVTVKSLNEPPKTISREFDIMEKPVTENPVTQKPVTGKP